VLEVRPSRGLDLANKLEAWRCHRAYIIEA
jgi:hypothetical protein